MVFSTRALHHHGARRGERYLEVDIDVGSSRSAQQVVGLVTGALKSLIIELAVVLEGRFQACAVLQHV